MGADAPRPGAVSRRRSAVAAAGETEVRPRHRPPALLLRPLRLGPAHAERRRADPRGEVPEVRCAERRGDRADRLAPPSARGPRRAPARGEPRPDAAGRAPAPRPPTRPPRAE